MAGKKRSVFGALNWFVHSWYLPAAIIVLLILGVIVWALPWRTDLIVSTDDSHRWFAWSAPPQRKVVWEPPKKVVNLFADKEKGSFITPRLIDHGATLYFSYCPETEGKTDFDIYRSRLIDGKWQPAEAVEELNTDKDDICFSFSPNGRTMYLYSSHAYPGAQGQFDIYVSHRVKSGWSTPQNLGPKVNSDYDEFEPAIAPDGKTLVFASNRTLKEKNMGVPRKRWVATLRADLGQAYFDLYSAARADPEGEWAQSQPITRLNKKDYKDGSPYFSPSGEFLYFASNRPIRPNEPPNLDLFRARFAKGRFEDPENLGDVINTQEQETEPGLSPEGFTLLFSSDREGADILYSSKAVEVYHATEWDDGRWAIFTSLWWKVLGLLLLLALVAYLIYRLRHWLFDRATAGRFIAASLILHLLFIIVMGYLSLVTNPGDIIRVIMVEPPPETQVFESAQDQPSYEKVADLKALEQANLPDLMRQAVQAPPQTMQKTPTASANIPVQINPIAPSQKLPEIKPLPERTAPAEPKLAKKRSVNNLMVAKVNPIDLKLPQEVKQQVLKQIQQQKVDLDRRESAVSPNVKAIPPAPSPLKMAKLTPLKFKPAGLAPPKIDVPKETSKTLPKKSTTKMVQAAPLDQKLKLALPQASNPVQLLNPMGTKVNVGRKTSAALTEVKTQLPKTSAGAKVAKLSKISIKPIGIAEPKMSTQNRIVRDLPKRKALQGVQSAPLGEKVEVKLPFKASKPNLLEPKGVPVKVVRNTTADSPDVKKPLPPTPSPAVKGNKIQTVEIKPKGLEAPNIPRKIIPSQALPKHNPVKVVSAALGKSLNVTAPSEIIDPKKLDPQGAAVSVPRQGNAESKTLQVAQSKSVKVPMIKLPRKVPGAPVAANAAKQELPAKGIASPLKKTPVAAKTSIAADPAAVDAKKLVIGGEDSPQLAPASATKIPALRAKVGPLVPDGLLKRTPLELPSIPRVGFTTVKNAQPNSTPSVKPLGVKNVKRKLPVGLKLANAKPVTQQRLMFMLRNKTTKKQATKIFGGTKQSEEAVELGLKWLAQNQEGDGSWRLRKFQSSTRSQTAGTAFGLLPFLGAGYSHKSGKYKETVTKGLKWLVKIQKKNGDLLYRGDNQGHHMYAHGLAAIALCEAYAMTKDPALRDSAQRAVNFIVAAQHKPSGGWRYQPRQLGDTSVLGWQVMALKSGQMAGLMVPQSVFDGAKRWLKRVESNQPVGGQFGYQGQGARPTMTAQGLLALELMGIDRDSPRLQAGVKYLQKYLPKRNSQSSYYYYHATQVMYHMQGDIWKTWNDKIRDLNVKTQIKSGRYAGSWTATDNWERSGGRIMATSLRLLMLEVYYRHLPLYQQLEG